MGGSDDLLVGWINSASPVYAGDGGAARGTAGRKVPEQRGAAACLQRSSAFMPVLPRIEPGAGALWSACVVGARALAPAATERRAARTAHRPRVW
jgi:hypothetical protein